jgi:hypothetical protein
VRTSPEPAATLARWGRIPERLRRAVAGASRRELASRGGGDGRTAAEYVHHLVEANLVAASIVLAAVGSPGSEYDWSWLVPDESWMKRLGYARLPVEPAIRLLDALCAHLSSVLRGSPGSLRRVVRLRGTSGIERSTVERVLADEWEHAEQHLRDIRAALAARARAALDARTRRRVRPAGAPKR